MYAVSLQKRFKAWAPIRARRLKIHIKIHFQNPFGNSGKRNNVTVSGTQNRFSPRAPTFNVGAGPKSCALMPNIEGGGRGGGADSSTKYFPPILDPHPGPPSWNPSYLAPPLDQAGGPGCPPPTVNMTVNITVNTPISRIPFKESHKKWPGF